MCASAYLSIVAGLEQSIVASIFFKLIFPKEHLLCEEASRNLREAPEACMHSKAATKRWIRGSGRSSNP